MGDSYHGNIENSKATYSPRTSKGITDLLLLNLVLLDAASPSKKNLDRTKDDATI